MSTKLFLTLFMMAIATYSVDVYVDPANYAGLNYVVNGGFEVPSTHNSYVFLDNVPGWITNKGEFGLSSLYNLNWGLTQVIELDGEFNTFYRTFVQLPARAKY